eukprot:4179771-Amphidinium_carterae.1
MWSQCRRHHFYRVSVVNLACRSNCYPCHAFLGQSLTSRCISTSEAYRDLPAELQPMSGKRQGSLFEKLSVIVHTRQGWVVEDASSQSYDYTIRCPQDGTQSKVEVKCSRLCWCKVRKAWYLTFYWVKPEEFDILNLGVMLPTGAALWKYDLSKNIFMSTSGKSTDTKGMVIRIRGSSRRVADSSESWSDAWVMDIRPKLSTAADLQAEFSFDKDWLGSFLTTPSRADMEYNHSSDPFSLLCGA